MGGDGDGDSNGDAGVGLDGWMGWKMIMNWSCSRFTHHTSGKKTGKLFVSSTISVVGEKVLFFCRVTNNRTK
jgi:hypothetical protein